MKPKKRESHYEQYEIDFINEMANENSDIILEDLGFSPRRNGDLQCACPIHDGDNRNGFSFKKNLGSWKCWTNKCHEKYGSTLIGLVIGMKKIPFPKAMDYIVELLQLNLDTLDPSEVEIKSFIGKQRKKEILVEKIYNSEILRGQSHEVPELFDFGFSPEILQKFQIFISREQGKKLYGRITVPIFNSNRQLIGFGGKRTDLIKDNPIKWLYVPDEIALTKNLFAAHFAYEYILSTKTVVIVESMLDAVKCHQSGITNCISTFSANISEDHIKILLGLGVKKIINLFDPDKGGESGTKILEKNASKFFKIYDIRSIISKDPSKLEESFLRENVKTVVEEIINL